MLSQMTGENKTELQIEASLSMTFYRQIIYYYYCYDWILYIIVAIDQMFVSPHQIHVKTLIANVMVFGGEAFERQLGLLEVIRVNPPIIALVFS